MNIFVVDHNPYIAAQLLPDKHVVKMILESAQMLSLVYSEHYWDIGIVRKKDGTPFNTKRGAFKNHPCTKWAAASQDNCDWLLAHAIGLCAEYNFRYNKTHGLYQSIVDACATFNEYANEDAHWSNVTSFARAMPDVLKYDGKITDVQAYRTYLNTKEWVKYNYLRIPLRKPNWIN